MMVIPGTDLDRAKALVLLLTHRRKVEAELSVWLAGYGMLSGGNVALGVYNSDTDLIEISDDFRKAVCGELQSMIADIDHRIGLVKARL